MTLSRLMSIWRARNVDEWLRSPGKYRSFAEKVLAQGEPLLAYDVVNDALAKWPQDTRLRQLQGLALARSGATERANAALEKLRQAGQADEETLGMLARTYKDLASQTGSRAERKRFLHRAAEIYLQAYESTGGYWSGINAATMNLLIGETKRATELAIRVRKQCHKSLSAGCGDEYWLLAALGEAALILRDWTEGEKWYRRAAKRGAGRFGDLQSSRRNAHLILQYWKADTSEIDGYLSVPPVVVFSGHMIDEVHRVAPRFPASLEPAVARALRDKIDKLGPCFGFASAACGSDILFLEAMLDAGAEIHIVLPYNKEEFIRDSVDFLPDSNWRARFERLLRRAAQCVTASTQKLKLGTVSYEFGNELLLGLARTYSLRLGTTLIPLAVWDGFSGDGPGGTASAVKKWRAVGYKPEIVNLATISPNLNRRSSARKTNRANKAAFSKTGESRGFTSRIVAILFADAVGFSKLTEDQIPRFIRHYLGAIAQLSRKFREGVIAKNTWGDGLYLIFSDVDLAGKFALDLADLVTSRRWTEEGLPSELSLRIALHAGPVYEFRDPITGDRTYGGSHVNRAARIEPITPSGQVYASEAFAALSAVRCADSFVCEYVGQIPLAKGYGTFPAYHVRRRFRSGN
jgi:class 3 adenylate cyclase